MKLSDSDIGGIIKEALKNKKTSTSFEEIWSKPKVKNTFSLRKRFAIPVIAIITIMALLTVGFASYEIYRKVDKTDYPFVNDENVIGKWKTVDFVKNISDFNQEKKSWNSDFYLTGLVFIKEGRMLGSYDNNNLAYVSTTWTKGKILSKQEKTDSAYEIRNKNGKTYLFMQWKSGDYSFRGMVPYYYVLEKVDSKDYSDYKVTSIREDKTDYPFVNDENVIGKWKTVDFVKNKSDFQGKKSWCGELYLTGLVFIKEGKMLGSYSNDNIARIQYTWTKDKILNKYEKTDSAYEIRDISGKTYLFMQWKSGDYTFRGMEPYYYVLEKVDSKDYSDYKGTIVKEDKIDYPFKADKKMLGSWESVDFVKDIDQFDPDSKSWISDLFLLKLVLSDNGEIISSTTDKSEFSNENITWTKGLIINKYDKTASKCIIKEIDGNTYMFYEWKSGDYVYRGMKPFYYVLKKIN